MNDSYATVPPVPNPLDRIATKQPSRIGRYRIDRILGEGGFGLVYLAHDEQLQRPVAVKVPHPHLVAQESDAEAYLTEARTVANLDHPNIVPVYDVGSTEDCPCYVVSKFIEGSTLAQRIAANRLSVAGAAELAATVAETLHYAHKQGIVHRDIKPGNILLDSGGKPFVADFGLALRERDFGKGAGFAGTPAYMSPEQARGEGHRVDGRSDLFSLGVVFYELLTGRRPFAGEILSELLEQVTRIEVRPPRQVDDTIPKELERICLKALAKRASERYTTARDMADDLRHWLRPLTGGPNPVEVGSGQAEHAPQAELPATPGLVKDAFLSYATADQEAAFRLCRHLEEQGIGCWIAPRDVSPGADYGQAIIRAIEETATTLLLLSTHANASIHVTHEVERATSKRKRLIPVRLEDVVPGPSLELHLATAQWVDAWRLSPDQVAAQLAVVLRGKALATPPSPTATPPITPSSDQRPIKIVPKGLRSFDAGDADFFLELLPGPRDRDGLPDNIRFWKTRIEETDPDNTFTVGLIYGPSGCGKSSLVKAGLLPRLAASVMPIYVEATSEETEVRLVKGLRKHCPDLPVHLNLIETLTALRRGQGIPVAKKVLIVLDQFEQWLHAKKEQEDTELVQALRQCNGQRVQCIVMVRDDFWMAATRFMRELEVRLLEGQNSAAVDLFPIRHAEKVLAAFGRAFGALPDAGSSRIRQNAGELPERPPSGEGGYEFVKQAVAGLAQEGKVISVRLALFAEMMKGKAWTPGSLKAVGGTEGVGVTFLEETFSAANAPPEHRYHQKAARAVLKALLPESGTNIKGHMRSYAELLEASGYASRRRDFDDLIRILDSEVRLITPTDPEGNELARRASEGSAQLLTPRASEGLDSETHPSLARRANERRANEATRYYQLTHDYLVGSLRDWLTRKQKETRRGRAELVLADRAVVWNARTENRQLPSIWQWLSIRCLTQKKNWTPPQKKLMRKAGRYHAVRGLIVAMALALLGGGIYEGHGRLQAHALTDSLLRAETMKVPDIVAEMPPYRRWINRLLHDAYDQAEANDDTRKQLHASLALLPVDASQVDYLYGRLLDAEPGEVPVIRDYLATYQSELADKLWAVVRKPEERKERQRLRAAAALAKYDPDSQEWNTAREQVVDDLVREPAVYLATWMDLFRPVREKLQSPLGVVYRNGKRRETERSMATGILADYAADQPNVLADLLMDADETQFAVLYPKFKEQGERGLPVLTREIDKKLPPELPSSDEGRDKLAKRQANAAVTLLRMSSRIRQNAGDEPPTRILANAATKVWPLLKHSTDPRVRSYLIHRLSPLGADAGAILKRLDEELDVTIRRALLLSLGEFSEKDLSPDNRKALLRKSKEMYRMATDPGLHAACEWLLQRWKATEWLRQTKVNWAKDNEQREKWLQGIKGLLTKHKEKTPPQWYVNGQGQTMVVIPGPVSFLMGSPAKEEGRSDNEPQHKKRIGRSYALAAQSVTWEQYLKFAPQDKDEREDRFSPTIDCPANYISWYMATAYCNWLSKEEGIDPKQWCYEGKGKETKLRENYLSLTGYRLPTEAEMEYATRAGAATSRYFGETDELLPKYAWYLKNSKEKTWPVGSLKPNDLGLFDVQGNVYTWCQEGYKSYPQIKNSGISEDKEDTSSVVISTDGRVLRGGSFVYLPMNVRSAYRVRVEPATRNLDAGVRPARTFR